MEGVVVFDEKFFDIAFTPFSLRDAWTSRVRIFMEKFFPLLRKSRKIKLVDVKSFGDDILLLAHESRYVEFVKEMSRVGKGFLDYGDTPAYPGVFEDALFAVSGTLTLADFVLAGEKIVGFNPQGGFHHARSSSAGGFCVFNDLAIAVRYLRKNGIKRIAVVDIDAHHGDGTEEILYREDVLKISIHGYGYGFYPGTGWIDELGENGGYCYNINIPVPLSSGDDIFKLAVSEIIIPVLSRYKPEVLIVQNGADGHMGDPLVGLNYSDNSYTLFGEILRGFAEKGVPIILTGGGGYVPQETARIWALVITKALGLDIPELRPREDETVSTHKIMSIVKDRVYYLKGMLENCEKI